MHELRKKQKFARTRLVRRPNHVVLNPEIFDQKLDWCVNIGLDSTRPSPLPGITSSGFRP